MEVERAVDESNSATLEEFINADEKPPKKCTSSDASSNGCFDCNICLDSASDPVVTLCGHLYCWPCIYRWLQPVVDGGSSPQQCPVCKASLLQQSLMPLYGRGRSSKKTQQSCDDVPCRPPVRRDAIEQLNEQLLHPQPHHHQLLDYPLLDSSGDYSTPPLGTTRVMHSTAGEVLGGMAVAVLPWMFRNQEWANVYYSSPYQVAGNGGGSPTGRRQELEVERSLRQIWAFLFCCAILCLLLF